VLSLVGAAGGRGEMHSFSNLNRALCSMVLAAGVLQYHVLIE
jgi:hypothetical protein